MIEGDSSVARSTEISVSFSFSIFSSNVPATLEKPDETKICVFSLNFLEKVL